MKKNLLVVLACVLIALVVISCDDPKHEHAYGTKWEYDDTNHWHECECGEKCDIAEHIFGDWKAGENGKHYRECSVCDYKEEKEHSYGGNVVKNSKVVKVCSICGNEIEGDSFDKQVTTASDLKEFLEGTGEGTATSAILVNDIELKESVTSKDKKVLDLGGKTVSISVSLSANSSVITNEGDLTINNGTIEYKKAESFVWVLHNKKILKAKDVVFDYEIKKNTDSTTSGTSIGVLKSNSGAVSVSLDRCNVALSVPETGTGIKLTAFYVSSGTFEISDSEIVATTVRDGDIRGIYAYINSTSTSGVTGSVKNTNISVTSSAKGAVAPVFAESYCAYQARIELKNCTLTATSTVADNGDRTTYCIRTKGPTTITIDDFTYEHCAVSGNTHKEGCLGKFGASKQTQSSATSDAKDKTGVIKRGDEVIAGSES